MIRLSDKEFDASLANPEALEKQLEKLVKERRMHSFVTAFSTAVCFLNIFVILWASYKAPNTFPGAAVAVALTMLAGMIQQTASALTAHADIRALQSYKRLREMQAFN